MSSRWYCRTLGQELGPVAFGDLVEMVRQGSLGRDDQVRRDNSTRWSRAEEVVGLFRAATLQSRDTQPQSSDGSSEIPTAGGPSAVSDRPLVVIESRSSPEGYRPFIYVAVTAALLSVVAFVLWLFENPNERFPASRTLRQSKQHQTLPVFGQASAIEIAVLWGDLAAVAAGSLWWISMSAARRFRTRRDGMYHRTPVRQSGT